MTASNSNWTSGIVGSVTATTEDHPQYHFDIEVPVFAKSFEQELAELINKHSLENESNTPDFILAEYMRNCLDAFAKASKNRERWFGKSLSIDGSNDKPSLLQPDTIITNIGNNLDMRG